MTLPKTYVDGFLVEWEAGEYEAQVRSSRQQSQKIEPVIPIIDRRAVKPAVSTARRAQQVRERLGRTVRKSPEVMVKITSACRGMTQVGRHIDYISRIGQIDLEDQDGLVVRGKDVLKELKEDWRIGGPEDITKESDRRDTLNIVFSMPAHTDEVSMRRAVRAFAASEFDGHQYVFAYHTQATDPNPNPPAHPHVHLSIKTLGWSGQRLNPRKADLQRWRERFAEQLRAHGIEANATSRLARLRHERGESRAVVALKDRREFSAPGSREGPERRARRGNAKKLEAKRLAYYALAIEVLSRSEDPADNQLSCEMEKHFGIRSVKYLDTAQERGPTR